MPDFHDLPQALSEQIMAELEAARDAKWSPMAWYLDRPKEPQEIDEAQRIQGLATYWAEAKATFAYWDKIPHLDWDAAFRAFLPQVVAASDPAEYYRVLRRFSALLRDGHTQVIPPLWVAADVGFPPLHIYPVEGLPVVLSGQGLPPGAVILSIDGQPATLVVEERLDQEIGSTDHDRLQRVCRSLLKGPRGSQVRVEARLAGGETVMATLERTGPLPQPPTLERVDLGEGRVLARINSWSDPQVVSAFSHAFPDFDGIRCLIIDLRQNGGGNSASANAILARLVDRPVRGLASRFFLHASVLSAWALPQPAIATLDDPVQPDYDHPRYTGPIAVLTSTDTYSAAEDFCAAFRASGRGPLVGEPTGGSTGQAASVPLPGGGVGMICARRCTFADGGEFVGVGIQPHVAAPPTIAGVAAGRDETLAAALAVLGF